MDRPAAPALRPPRSPGPHRGFTLIEVLVALFIMAVMSGMAWQGINAVVRSREVVQQRMERLLRLQTVLGQWETDLQALVDTQIVPGMMFDGATLRLTRQQPDGVQVVAWSLRADGLHRWASQPLTGASALQDQWMRSYQLLGGEAEDVLALQGLTQWQLYVFNSSSNAWSNAQSSADVQGTTSTSGVESGEHGGTGRGSTSSGNSSAATSARAGQRDVLPDGVRAVFSFSPGGAADGPVTRDIRLVHP
jgi:general secretion pathway protein J